MYSNIGGKIKAMAVGFAWIGFIASALYGFVLLSTANDAIFIIPCILLIVFGCLVSWLSSLALYAFGQLIENSDTLVELNLKNNQMIAQILRNNQNSCASGLSQAQEIAPKAPFQCSCGALIQDQFCSNCGKKRTDI